VPSIHWDGMKGGRRLFSGIKVTAHNLSEFVAAASFVRPQKLEESLFALRVPAVLGSARVLTKNNCVSSSVPFDRPNIALNTCIGAATFADLYCGDAFCTLLNNTLSCWVPILLLHPLLCTFSSVCRKAGEAQCQLYLPSIHPVLLGKWTWFPMRQERILPKFKNMIREHFLL
jgi:hypothetical protein